MFKSYRNLPPYITIYQYIERLIFTEHFHHIPMAARFLLTPLMYIPHYIFLFIDYKPILPIFKNAYSKSSSSTINFFRILLLYS